MAQNSNLELLRVDAVNRNDYGEITLTEQEAFEALYNGKINSLEDVYVDTIKLYNDAREINADRIPKLNTYKQHNSLEEFDKANQLAWFMPKDHFPNLMEYLYGCCTTEEQTNRVSQELELFSQHGMIDVLFYCKYLVDTMREHKILWGVGRGSSVASYVLYLIGIHKIDSLLYKLEINEFLK